MVEALSPAGTTGACALLDRFLQTRRFTEQLCHPLSPEDCSIQSMPDVSPTRWHLAHTTWFFEEFLLSHTAGYRPFHPDFGYLFNSYYNTVGEQYPRAQRGLLSRPGLDEIRDYRQHVDQHMRGLLQKMDNALTRHVCEIGIQHEQQHQELILTDIKHVLSCNPLLPAYLVSSVEKHGDASPHRWLSFPEGLREIGHSGDEFAYDNESPRHREFLEAFELTEQLVTAGEYLEFIVDGGYRRPDLWLSAGWQAVRDRGWEAPLYWQQRQGEWSLFALSGSKPVNAAEPVCHVSYFEADAFARWAGARLPTEAEWETACQDVPVLGNFADSLLERGESLHPARLSSPAEGMSQMFGDVWEWTASPYTPYPGYRPPEGALGEYNGKFMCNQYVLRGGSCATSHSHIRRTYRNFFPPDARWQFSGIRLAR